MRSLYILKFSVKVTRLSTAEELREFLGGIATELWNIFRVTMDKEDQENDDNEDQENDDNE